MTRSVNMIVATSGFASVMPGDAVKPLSHKNVLSSEQAAAELEKLTKKIGHDPALTGLTDRIANMSDDEVKESDDEANETPELLVHKDLENAKKELSKKHAKEASVSKHLSILAGIMETLDFSLNQYFGGFAFETEDPDKENCRSKQRTRYEQKAAKDIEKQLGYIHENYDSDVTNDVAFPHAEAYSRMVLQLKNVEKQLKSMPTVNPTVKPILNQVRTNVLKRLGDFKSAKYAMVKKEIKAFFVKEYKSKVQQYKTNPVVAVGRDLPPLVGAVRDMAQDGPKLVEQFQEMNLLGKEANEIFLQVQQDAVTQAKKQIQPFFEEKGESEISASKHGSNVNELAQSFWDALAEQKDHSTESYKQALATMRAFKKKHYEHLQATNPQEMMAYENLLDIFDNYVTAKQAQKKQIRGWSKKPVPAPAFGNKLPKRSSYGKNAIKTKS